jgi:hypothetical protein
MGVVGCCEFSDRIPLKVYCLNSFESLLSESDSARIFRQFLNCLNIQTMTSSILNCLNIQTLMESRNKFQTVFQKKLFLKVKSKQ